MKKTLSVTLSSALLIGLSSATAQAGENPFTLQELSSGYQLSQMDETPAVATAKAKDGKCGENKCGQGKCGVKK